MFENAFVKKTVFLYPKTNPPIMRPYVIINCAMSLDGKIALPSRIQTRISSEDDMARVYKLRNECDAVLVGIETILSDDPKLSVKDKYVPNPNQPYKIVIDSKCRIPSDAKVFENNKAIIVTTIGKSKELSCEIIECGDDKVDLKKLLEILFQKGIKKILVEGGGTIIWSFLRENLVDELYIFIGNIIIGGKNSPTFADGEGVKNFNEIIKLKLSSIDQSDEGILLRYKL